MKINLLLALSLICCVNISSFAQCEEENETKVLLIGDSWAAFMHGDVTFNNVFDTWGQSNFTYYSNLTLAVNGARAEDFLEEGRLEEIQNQLNTQPSIEVVHISLSGNDFLGNWTTSLTEEENEALSDETFDELIELVDFIKGVRPTIQIVFSGYMYANFAEVIADAAPFETSHPFYTNWEEMGFPTFEQLNGVLNDFSNRVEEYAFLDPQIDFINVPALMQRVYGQETELGVDPGGTYPVGFQPLPFGDVTYPSPKVSMRDYGLVRDCFHLSEDGYLEMIGFQFQKFYHKYLMDDVYLLSDVAANMGAVNASGDVNTALNLGEVDGENNVNVLSFITVGIPDTIISNASLFLRRETLIGGNPLGATVTLRMKSGHLGSSITLQADDYADEGDIEGEACVFGSSENDGHWIRIDLPEAFLPLISGDNITQFSIAINDASGEAIQFTDGADAEFAPVLNLKFKSIFASVEEETEIAKRFVVYPNPATSVLNIFTTTEKYSGAEIYNMQGQLVITANNVVQGIDISELPAGNYLVKIQTNDGVAVEKFVKK